MRTTDEIIDKEFYSYCEPLYNVLEVLKLSIDDWCKLNLYEQVHINEFWEILMNLTIAPTSILEWGSGLSTYVLYHFGRAWDCEYLLSIDHNHAYQQMRLACLEPSPFFHFKSIDLKGGVWPWDQHLYNYATYPLTLGREFDLIFVDGRRRNECLLVANQTLSNHGIVILHDAWRERYQPGISLFKPEQSFDGYLIMKNKSNIGIESMSEILRAAESG